jgi:CheY-like chemotaxis protein
MHGAIVADGLHHAAVHLCSVLRFSPCLQAIKFTASGTVSITVTAEPLPFTAASPAMQEDPKGDSAITSKKVSDLSLMNGETEKGQEKKEEVKPTAIAETNDGNESNELISPSALPSPLWRLRITVRDEGIGISAETMSKLFMSFSQAREVAATFGGTGLGLCISKSIAEAMGGNITCTSTLGKGSSFVVQIQAPMLVDATPTEENVAPHRVGDASACNPCSLTVEDVDALRDSSIVLITRDRLLQSVQSWGQLLRTYGAHVYLADEDECDTTTADEAHASSSPAHRLLVLYRMPELLSACSGGRASRANDGAVAQCPLAKTLSGFGPLSVLSVECGQMQTPTSVSFPNSLRVSSRSPECSPLGMSTNLSNEPESAASTSASTCSAISIESSASTAAAVSTEFTCGQSTWTPELLPETRCKPTAMKAPAPMKEKSSADVAVLLRKVTDSLTRCRWDATRDGNGTPRLQVTVLTQPFKMRDLLIACASLVRRANSSAGGGSEDAAEAPSFDSSPAAAPTGRPRHAHRASEYGPLSETKLPEAPLMQRSQSHCVAAAASSSSPSHKRAQIVQLASEAPLRILLCEDNLSRYFRHTALDLVKWNVCSATDVSFLSLLSSICLSVNQKMMQMLLSRLGYRIQLAVNGQECLDVLEQQSKRGPEFSIEVVLMDANMVRRTNNEAHRGWPSLHREASHCSLRSVLETAVFSFLVSVRRRS